jgi:hypothetical protein
MYRNQYKPYNSDSESDSESEFDTTDSESTTSTSSTRSEKEGFQMADFSALANGLALPSIFDVSGKQVDFNSSGRDFSQVTSANSGINGFELGNGGVATFKKFEVAADASGSVIGLTSSSQSITNVIMVDSRDRDKAAYAQPTNLSLRLPRVYKNITGISITQMKFLCSFYYFSAIKVNTSVSILEIGRTITNPVSGVVSPNIIANAITDGTYDINALVAEITNQLNYTPPFYDYPNGFQDFAKKFSVTGDFSLNFNYPGDTYYNILENTYKSAPTMSYILSQFFSTRYAGLSSYSGDQIKVAYYYPALKQILIDPTLSSTVNLNITQSTGSLLPQETVYTRCVFTFQGINDAVVLEVIGLNVSTLETYRLNNTFRYSLINKYVLNFNSQANTITFTSPTLNTSLYNLLTTKSNQFLADQLSFYGITADQYALYNSQNTILLAIINDMNFFYQKFLAEYFGIQFNGYSLDYLMNSNFTLPIRDALNAFGVATSFSGSSGKTQTTDILLPFRRDPPQYWNRLQGMPATTVAYMNPQVPGDNPVQEIDMRSWNMDLAAQNPSSPFILPNSLDSNNPNTTPIGRLYINRRTQSADIIMPIEAQKYTTFRFKSPVRQTMKVAVLPRPTQYRYPAYNAITYDVSNQVLFDNSYCFVDVGPRMDISSNDFNVEQIQFIPGFSQSTSTASFGIDVSTSLSYWGSTTTTVSILQTRNYFEFYTPFPPGYDIIGAPAYKYPLRLTIQHAQPAQNFQAAVSIFLYQDRGGFMADISGNGKESVFNYLQVISTTTTLSTATLDFTAYANKKYYVLTRGNGISFPTETYRIAASFPSTTNYEQLTDTLVGFNPLADPTLNLNNYNYAQVADPAFIALPTASTIVPTPSVDLTTVPLIFETPLMGYDIAGITTDLTNYVGFIPNVASSNAVPTAKIRIDPTNGYLFQSMSPYNVSTQTYFYSTSINAILNPRAAGIYVPSTIQYRQKSIVNWYGNTFIAPSANQVQFPPGYIAYTAIPPYTASYPLPTMIPGYTYADLLDVSGNPYLGTSAFLNTGDGVFGIGFVPEQGEWDIDTYSFKSIFTSSDPAIDPNLQIKYIGIYPASVAANIPVQQLSLSTATVVMQYTSSITYNSSNLNFGFDAAGGTFYQFSRRAGVGPSGSNAYLYGYTQPAFSYNFDINSFYVAVPFNSSSNAVYFQGLVGSVVPYPLYSQMQLTGSVPSPEGQISTPTGANFIVPGGPLTNANPIYGPPTGYTQSQIKYEQSMTTGTNFLLYANPYGLNIKPTPIQQWSPFPYPPTEVITDCAGFILAKDSQFRVFSYPINISSYTLTETYQFTLDQVYPSGSNIQYLGMAANENEFAFFGFSNAPTPYIFIRTMNPTTGTIQTTTSNISPFGFQSSIQLYKALYNNVGGYVLSGTTTTGGATVVAKANYSTTSLTYFTYSPGAQSTITRFEIGQSPKEEYGRYWVFPYRTGLAGPISEGVQDFIEVNPNTLDTSPQTGNYLCTYIAGATTLYALLTGFTLETTAPYTFRSPIVTRDVEKNRIFMLSEDDPVHFYEAEIRNGFSTPTIIKSVYSYVSTPSSLYSGADGGNWALLYDTLYGNRFDAIDAPKTATTAWQIFYPVHRIVFHQISKNFNMLENLTGLDYPEYPHTALTIYDSSGAITADTSRRWGLESSGNFITGDYTFSGQYFDAYIYAVPLLDNRSSDDYYYMTVRNYSPTEKSQVMLRVSAPNQYTFGYVTPTDLASEISTAKYVASTNDYLYTYYWDQRYSEVIRGFDSNFIIGPGGKTFGNNIIDGYGGSNISSVTGFGDFYGRLQGLYVQYSTQVSLLNLINSAVTSNTNAFIQSDLQYIIPASALNRQRSTDPLLYSILWKSALLPAYVGLEEEWGLGWNLGFDKVDTPYNTVHTGQSFFKILDDFISLRLNYPESDMNKIDTSKKENLAQTQDAQGVTKAYFGKLLLANFANFAQTMVSNPVAFLNPFGKLDKLTFQWVNRAGQIIDNNDCEWNAVIQITEKIDVTAPVKLPVINPSP